VPLSCRTVTLPPPPGRRARVVALASGAGTLLAGLLAATAEPGYPAEVVAVITDRPGAPALGVAQAAGVATAVCALADHPDRQAWDAALCAAIQATSPDLVVTPGFMRVLGPAVLGLGVPVVNTHPALLPAFPGAHPVPDTLAYGVRVSGATVHLVDAGTDTGPVLAQQAVPVLDTDTVQTLHARIKDVERPLLVDVVARLSREGFSTDGRKARFGP